MQHPIPFETGDEEKLLWRFSMSQSIWIVVGVALSYQMTGLVPPLPLPNIFGYLHYLLPLLVCATFAFVKVRDMTLFQFARVWIRFRRNKQQLLYRQPSKGGDERWIY